MDQIVGYLIAINLIEQLMAGLGIKPVRQVRASCSAIFRHPWLELARATAYRIAAAGNQIDRQRFRHAIAMGRAGNRSPSFQQVEPELHCGGKSAQRIGNIFIHLGRITREPIERASLRAQSFC